MVRPIGVLTTVILGLTGCAWHDIYTLSPAVKESAHQYSDVMDDFADEALLANVLRARDYAPLNFNDLSAITGSMSLSGTASVTLPFGPFIGPRYPAATSLGMFRDTGMPSFTGSSSPVITLGTLNTQGFMMTMIQPISTTYILSKWDSYPHELLLLLFIKSIRFPSDPTDIKPSIYRNDPDTPGDFHDFQALIEKMLVNTVTPTGRIGNVDMKSLMILDPLGDPVPMGQTLAATSPIPSQTLSVPAPAAPKMDGAAANESPVGTYYAKVTYVTNLGETLPSSETSFKVDGTATKGVEILLTQPSPPQGAPSAMGYNVYVSLNSAGQETRQNPRPLPLGSPWPVPKGGLITGPFPPHVKNGAYANSLPVAPGTQYLVSSDYNIFQTINGLTDGQLHVGNAKCPQYVSNGPHSDSVDLCPPGAPAPFAQFYKEYPAQIVLCLDTQEGGMFDGHYIYASSEKERQAFSDLTNARTALAHLQSEQIQLDELSPSKERETRAAAISQQQANAQEALQAANREVQSVQSTVRANQEKAVRVELESFKGGSNTASAGSAAPAASNAGASGSAAGGGGGGGSGGNTSSAGAMGQVTLALQPSRISAIVPSTMCRGDQIVLHQETEEDYDDESHKFTHIEWRSIAEVIQYLGAVARFEHQHDGNVSWPIGAPTDRLFTYARGKGGRITVGYRGKSYSVPSDYENPHLTITDHSLETLALLNELISIAKISGSLPVSQPVQVLP